MPRILFIHRHGPGQFVHLASYLARSGSEVTLLCETSDRAMQGVRVLKHRAVGYRKPEGTSSADYQLRMGAQVAEVLDMLRRQEGPPDIIVGHGGWGSLLFAKDVFPSTPVLGYCEFFYRPTGADVGFDPSVPTNFADISKLKGRNFAQISTLLSIEAGISPTRWQHSLFPAEFRPRIAIVHDGIDLSFCRPDPTATFTLPDGGLLQAGQRIVTFAARDLEPYRGFPQFMRAAARLARDYPDIVFVVAGGDGVSYGTPHASGKPWRHVMMEETGMDPSRIHFVGTLSHAELIRLFQISAAHVYLTYPFVLSWSILEAMACGAMVVASATAPVTEFIEDGKNGLLTPFFDMNRLCANISNALSHPAAIPIRDRARETVRKRADLDRCIQTQIQVLREITGANRHGFVA